MALSLNLSALQNLKEINEKQQEIHFKYYILLPAQRSSTECLEESPEPWENVFYVPANSKPISLVGLLFTLPSGFNDTDDSIHKNGQCKICFSL